MTMNVQKFREFHSIANDFSSPFLGWLTQLNPDLEKKLDFLGVLFTLAFDESGAKHEFFEVGRGVPTVVRRRMTDGTP